MNIRSINDENCKQFVYEFGEANYMGVSVAAFRDFPYFREGLPSELRGKDMIEWFLFEWVNPKTGKTVVWEFVEKFGVPEPLRSKMLQMERMHYSDFRVLQASGRDMTIVDAKTQKKYEIVMVVQPESYKAGAEFIGRIHPWGDKHRLAGIASIRRSDEEIFQRTGIVTPDLLMRHMEKKQMAQIEANFLAKQSRISALLKNYPAHWVDGVCDQLKIKRQGLLKKEKIRAIEAKLVLQTKEVLSGLSEKELECLTLVVGAGGLIRYGKLKEFDDTMAYWWSEKGVNSTIGRLRAKALLFVGKTIISGRFFKAALVPSEILQGIHAYLAQKSGG